MSNQTLLVKELEDYTDVLHQSVSEYEHLIATLKNMDLNDTNAQSIATRICDIQEDIVSMNYLTRELRRQLTLLCENQELVIPRSEREPRTPLTKQEIGEYVARLLLLEKQY